ncbi:unnamed protein product [Larinioides sclopetarius]|uniref:Uncharacterized protein n=1 Tax=Larinioides sclopetarius TaxID=280406 RepID=A0AAV2BGK2_9ARAC
MVVPNTVLCTILALLGLKICQETPSTEVVDPDRIKALEGGCPDVTKCNIACQEDPQHQTKGSCVGPDETLCSCETTNLAPEQPLLNAEANACNEQECIKKCSVFPMPMTGRCMKGACQCGWYF